MKRIEHERGITERGRARHAARRLPAVERRGEIVAAALRVFTGTSYARATTAEIAREAGVSEPIIYRHFSSKRQLWAACVDQAWAELRATIEQKIGRASGSKLDDIDARSSSPWRSPTLPTLWIQGVMESGSDGEIERHVRAHIREVHDFVATLMRSHQEAGTMPADRDADAEAWIFVAGGLLRSLADRLGGVLTGADLEAIGRERRRWLSGDA